MDIAKQLKEELQIELWQVGAVIQLIDEGNTIPFIARYRKEKHGSLDDEQLRNLSERLTYLRNLEDKKKQVLASIEEQGKLTEELKATDPLLWTSRMNNILHSAEEIVLSKMVYN